MEGEVNEKRKKNMNILWWGRIKNSSNNTGNVVTNILRTAFGINI